jgi:excisionase family DNA binding protein
MKNIHLSRRVDNAKSDLDCCKKIMHNVVLSPIDPETLISSISERVTVNILKAIRNEQPTAEPPEQLLTVQEAAEFLRLTVPTMYSKVSKGELPVMKRGKRLYFSRTELMEYVKEGRKKSNAEIEAEAKAYLTDKKKGLNNGK